MSKLKIIGILFIGFIVLLIPFFVFGYKIGFHQGQKELSPSMQATVSNSCNAFIKDEIIPRFSEYSANSCALVCQQTISTLRCPVPQQTFQQFQIEYKTNLLLDKLLYQ